MKIKIQTKKSIQKFCDDNFISEGFDDKMVAFLKNERAEFDVDENGVLIIKLQLIEY
ncbi:MAG TPA: hypothetical protein VI815_04035 [Candidatus Nanoarchaeia archaeon]|nr:hypothetical protein [Candidatus Nanoarchaeia archaeon]